MLYTKKLIRYCTIYHVRYSKPNAIELHYENSAYKRDSIVTETAVLGGLECIFFIVAFWICLFCKLKMILTLFFL